jgi:hypothetical protein
MNNEIAVETITVEIADEKSLGYVETILETIAAVSIRRIVSHRLMFTQSDSVENFLSSLSENHHSGPIIEVIVFD